MSVDQKIEMPLEAWAEQLVDRCLSKHQNNCPVRSRVEKLELRFSSLIAFMAGSGLFGGAIGAVIAKFLGA